MTDSISCIGKNGEDASRALFDEFYSRVVRVARQRIPPHARRVADEEDIANSVMRTFFRRADKGEFPDLEDPTEIWCLLAKITVRKVVAYIRRETAQKRGGGNVRGDSAIAAIDESWAGLVTATNWGNAEHLEVGVFIDEQLENLFASLGDEKLQQILALKLRGYTHAEIGREMGTVEETVRRKLNRIRTAWIKEFGDGAK